MSKKTITIIALQAFIIIVLFWLLIFYGKDEYEEEMTQGAEAEEIETPSLVLNTPEASSQGAATLVLPIKVQQQSAISTAPLQNANYNASSSGFGTVVNLSSLIDARGRYLSALNDSKAAQASLSHSKQEYQRLKTLNQDDKNISDRALAAAEATLKNEQARISATQNLASVIKDAIRQEWGEAISLWATNTSKHDLLDPLIHQKSVLVRVTLPFGVTPNRANKLTLNPIGSHQLPIQAHYVSVAPQSDATAQGVTHFYTAPADVLRSGMRVNIKLKDETHTQQGVLVPHKAVVWYANQAWIYQKKNADRFVRRPIQTEIELEDGWFTQGFKAGDLVVVSGAQLLLSEEFKSQITNENDD
jgi:hypothetical protein